MSWASIVGSATTLYTAPAMKTHRHPDLGPRLEHGGDRARLRRRALAGAHRGGDQQPRRRGRAGVRARARHRHRGGRPHAPSPTRDAFDAELARVDRRASRPTSSRWPASCASSAPAFVQRYDGRLRQHPSVAAAGVPRPAHAPARASRPAARLAGATVHFVTAELDHGPIVDAGRRAGAAPATPRQRWRRACSRAST